MQVLNTGRYKCAEVSGLAQRFERSCPEQQSRDTGPETCHEGAIGQNRYSTRQSNQVLPNFGNPDGETLH
ncbi:hypothetical protein FCULG_00009809 [Fusarium culmorum]|uniref:Uncharacterized protein n=1 Tax=Fusarium culmorum TaxID=5516 RepID=A0A2T4GGS8_FUSCU|nr:hypothetical protein FCULG_00009809 [Fusarium culmorum]